MLLPPPSLPDTAMLLPPLSPLLPLLLLKHSQQQQQEHLQQPQQLHSGCAIQSDLFILFHVCFCSERAHTFQSSFSGLATQIPSPLISEEPRETHFLSWICTILPQLVKIVYNFSWHFYLNVVTRIKKCVKFIQKPFFLVEARDLT